MHAEPSKSAQERAKMIDILRKFEEGSAEDSLNAVDEENDIGSDLVKRFEGIDLDTAAPDMLWLRLTPEERRKFLKVIDNPESELAKQLLASEQLEKEIREPWWDSPAPPEEHGQVDHKTGHKFGTKPGSMSIPKSLVKDTLAGPSLVFNMAAICIAYAFATRQLAWSPLSSLPALSVDRQEAQKIISQLVPFLVDQSGTTLYKDMISMITDVWSRFETDNATPDLFAIILNDASKLLSPSPVVSVPVPTPPSDINIETYSGNKALLVLSDLAKLFERRKHIKYKLVFYAGHLMSTPNFVLKAVSTEAGRRARDQKELMVQ